ncbi:carbohydrate-binding domain-containing protein [Coprococcus sp. OM06-25]|uniref:carbohydrate-binding domain-containing protein n=1 Tax=Coprococcus sp. OM06-25 TaxID=2293094 RepID=UPI000E5C644F|nr:carbohydrate-binding domain-containing protein [Coprococcus sp. OM06-25]RGI41904.1 carbohydrate-binding domain-containing protein [Coprococcus sp. OM06-25]
MRKNKYMRHIAGIRKCLAIGLTAAMCMAMLAGCSTSQSTSSTSDTEVTSDVSTETDADKESPNGSADAENTSVKTEMTVEEMQAAIDEAMSDAAIDITDMFTKRDLAGTYDESEAVKITLSGKTAACNSSNVQIEDGVVTIKAAGVYVLSGTLTDGTIVVDAGDDDKVQLVLDGVSIMAADYAAIYAKNADKVFVTLAEGAGNSLTVSGDYVQTDDNNVDAVIFAKCDLTLNGTGSLTVKDNMGHGIVSKDDLVVTGGTYTIYSQDHCLNGKDSVRIADGTFNLSCDEDGIHAGNDDQQDGYVYIEGGDINISVGDDALHAEGLLIITGGDIDVSKSCEGVEGYKILVTGGDIDVVSSDDGFNAAGGSSGSGYNHDGFGGGPGMGGVYMDADSDAYIFITGGTININADGDGIDSNGCIGITGGSVYVLGPSDNGNGAMDYGICAAITGGEIVAVGGSGMAQGFGDESTQCSALVNFDEWIDAGETITLTNSDGKEVLSYKADKKFNSVVISTSDMKQGGIYTLTVGDQGSTFTLDDITYSEGSGGMQRPGGNLDNGGMQRPGGNSDDGNMQRPGGNSDDGNMQRPDGDSDNGQNDSANGSSQNKDNSSSSDSMSI